MKWNEDLKEGEIGLARNRRKNVDGWMNKFGSF
jgi:hypothetical protein